MRPFLTTLILALLPALAYAQPFRPLVHLVHSSPRSPRPLWREAVKPFHEAGIYPRLQKITRTRLNRAVGTGVDLIPEFQAVANEHQLPGVRTLILVPPPRDPYGRPISAGVAPIGQSLAICTLVPSEHLTTQCISHELGHSLGAHHTVGGLMNPFFMGATTFLPESLGEMVGILAAEAA